LLHVSVVLRQLCDDGAVLLRKLRRLFPVVPEEVLDASVDGLSMIVVRSGELLAKAGVLVVCTRPSYESRLTCMCFGDGPGAMSDKLYVVDSGECQLVEKIRDDNAKKKADRAVQERIVSGL
jgi:hypothetical protein